jgi:hypothetical protein
MGKPVDERHRRPLFREVDSLLGPPGRARIIFVRADTGLGKSTFLDTYHKIHWSSPAKCKRFRGVLKNLNELNTADVLGKINADRRVNTVVLLDALDEDIRGLSDCRDFDQEKTPSASRRIRLRTSRAPNSLWAKSIGRALPRPRTGELSQVRAAAVSSSNRSRAA